MTPSQKLSLSLSTADLLQDGEVGAASTRVSRALAEALLAGAPVEDQAFLHNLRGVVHLVCTELDKAMASFASAKALAPSMLEASYNLGLCHKHAKNWASVEEALAGVLQGAKDHLLACAEQNVAISRAARNLPVKPWSSAGKLGNLRLPAADPYSWERVWVQRMDLGRARILSVPRFSKVGRYMDVVLCDIRAASQPFFGPGIDAVEEDQDRLEFLALLEDSGMESHEVFGEPVRLPQAMAITDACREAGLHFEAWSVTMSLPGQEKILEDSTPLSGAVVIPTKVEAGRSVAEHAAAVLRQISRQIGVPLRFPSLLAAAGDELGALRHRRPRLERS